MIHNIDMIVIFEPIGFWQETGFSMVRVVANGACKKAIWVKWLQLARLSYYLHEVGSGFLI